MVDADSGWWLVMSIPTRSTLGAGWFSVKHSDVDFQEHVFVNILGSTPV